jgi:hypothetical protein
MKSQKAKKKMKIDLRSNIKQVTKGLSRTHKKQIPFAVSKTLNQLAFELSKKKGKGVVGRATNKKFDKKSGKGATTFTQKNFFYDKSSIRSLTATVFWDDRNADYMKFLVYGGTRFPNKRAIRVSTRHSNRYLDSFGNFKKGAIDEMMQDKSKFFSGSPKGAKKYSEGIWERYGRKTKKGGQKIRMVAAYEKDAQYKPLFPFGKIVDTYVFSQKHGFQKKFLKNLAKAIDDPK